MEHKKIPFSGATFVPSFVWFVLLVFLEPSNRLVDGRVLTNNKVVYSSTYRTILCMTEYMAVWMVYDTKYHCKKVYDTMRHFVYDTKRGCNFFAKCAKIGCMTQKCMTQKYRPFLGVPQGPKELK